MSDLVLYGIPPSTYLRTARLACEEKGVDYEVEPVDFQSEEFRSIHPFNRIPAMRHGDLQLYETSAICRYVDQAFDGPALVPADIKAAAIMEQWVSAANAYMDYPMIRVLVINRLVKPARKVEPDEAAIKDVLATIEYQLDLLNRALRDSEFLAGPDISIADFFVAPMVHYVSMTPEGQDLLPAYDRVGAWLDRMLARPSMQTATEAGARAAQ